MYDPLSDDAATCRNAGQAPRLLECSLHPDAAGAHFHHLNGVSLRRLSDYVNAGTGEAATRAWPNAAIISIGLTADERKQVLERALHPEVDQLGYDLPRLLSTWYGFINNRAGFPNPLVQGNGMPGAAYLQLAYDAAGVDLAPGSVERNVSNEHIWQAAKKLNKSIEMEGDDGSPVPREVVAFCCIRDPACVMFPESAKHPLSLADLV